MSYKIILLFFFIIFFRIFGFAQRADDDLLKKLQNGVDSIMNQAIQKEAFPGCVVYAAYQGRPFLFESYGFHTYDSLQFTYKSDIFDLASITKVMASTLAIMKLYESGLIDLDRPLKDYVKGMGWSKIGKTSIRECMAHQAGIKSWIKFYEAIQRPNKSYRWNTISSEKSDKYPYQVGEHKYLHHKFYKKIKRMIRTAPVQKDPQYQYSGLFFYLVPEIVQQLSGMPFDQYLAKSYYNPLGLKTMGFNPLDSFPKSRIVPTEIDTFFRYEPIHGKVHDEGAILMRGVSGNAGLFSDAEDLATLGQLLLDEGKLDSIRYLQPATIDLFTTYQYPARNNRRGLGFDKPLLTYDAKLSSVAQSASVNSYGHTGYTGTLIWMDPDYDFLYIFLSNRVYPDRNHKALYEFNVRPTVHQLLYEYIDDIEQIEINSNNHK